MGYWATSESGWMVQTSPLEPENMHRLRKLRTPRVRVKDSSKTDPPESQMRARVGSSVNLA